jgi:hypothetical protein
VSAIETVKNVAGPVLESPKVAAGVGGTTITSGLGTIFDLLPSGAQVATAAGTVLSLVLAWNHWKKGKLERRKLRMENELLRRELRKD